MSENHRQRRRRIPAQFWTFVFKTVVAIGQAAYLVAKLLSLRE